MKTIIAAILSLFACTAVGQYNISSKPFHLITQSHDEKYDGTYLFACHEGAAIEALCVGDKNMSSGSPFQFNTSTYDQDFNKTLGKLGYLTYTLIGGNFEVSSAMSLYTLLTTNVALPLFSPGDEAADLVAFDNQDRLSIQGYIDDTVVPAAAGPTVAYYRWYICQTYYTGYRYTTLTWVLGEGKPQNPSCCAVDVVRHFT